MRCHARLDVLSLVVGRTLNQSSNPFDRNDTPASGSVRIQTESISSQSASYKSHFHPWSELPNAGLTPTQLEKFKGSDRLEE